VTTTRASVAAAASNLSQTVAQIDGTTIADHPQVLAAAAAVRNAALACIAPSSSRRSAA